MTSRAILAKRTGRSRFKGVFHLGREAEENDPWKLGDLLISRVIACRGQLEDLMKELLDDAPWGWVSLKGRLANQDKKGDNKRLFTERLLEKRADLDVSWVYLFDLDARTLTISSFAEVGQAGFSDSPYAVIQFDERGRPNPRQIKPPPPRWPTLPKAVSWEGDDEGLQSARRRALQITDGWCSTIGLEPEELNTLVGAALWEVLRDAVPGEPEDLYVPAPLLPGVEPLYWGVECGVGHLYYPAPAWRRALEQAGQLEPQADTLPIWAGVHREAKADLSPRSVAAGYAGLSWPFEGLSPQDTVAAVLRGAAAGRHPRSDVDSEGLRVFRWMRVVQAVSDPDREVLVTANTETAMGEEVQNTLLFRWKWELLDWLRAGQVPVEGEVPADDGAEGDEE